MEFLTDWFLPNTFGDIKNEFRVVKDKDDIKYFEVKLTQDKTMLCDLKNYNLLQFKWCTVKYGNRYYAATWKFKNQHFHRLLYPEWKIIDHIN